MTKSFVVDLETMGLESNTIVLSAAVVYFSLDEDVEYSDLLKRACFVKFNAKEQAANKRTVTKSTLEWWKEQAAEVQEFSIKPQRTDLSMVDGLLTLKKYIDKHSDKNSWYWTRGAFDQMVLESLCRTAQVDPLYRYNMNMCIRTAIRCLKETSDPRGYCTIPSFDKDLVAKHNPIHDVCYDALQLIKGS